MDDIQTTEATTTSEAPIETTQQVHTPTPQDNSLYAMRKKLEAEEEARRAAERRAYELEQKLTSYNQPQQQQQAQVEEDDLAVDNDDYVQAKHIKTSNKKFSHKLSNTERKIAELEQKLAYVEAKSYTDALKDFNEIVTEDNIKTLAKLYPEDYETLQSVTNLRVKSKTAYNMIKNYGIVGTKDMRDAEARIQTNNQKPKLASLGSPQTAPTPLSRLNDYERRVLSEADKDRIMAEVERKKRGG